MEDFYFRNCSKSALEDIFSKRSTADTEAYYNILEFSQMYNDILKKLGIGRDSFSTQEVALSGQELAELLVRQTRIVAIELQARFWLMASFLEKLIIQSSCLNAYKPD